MLYIVHQLGRNVGLLDEELSLASGPKHVAKTTFAKRNLLWPSAGEICCGKLFQTSGSCP